MRASGSVDGTLAFTLPVQDVDNWQLDAELKADDAEAWLVGFEPKFTHLQGTGRIRNTQVSAAAVSAEFLGAPVTIDVQPANESDADHSHMATVVGKLPIDRIEAVIGLPDSDLLTGDALMQGTALFPVPDAAQSVFRILLESRLEGVISKIPYPAGKAAADSETMQIELQFPERGVIDVVGALERGIRWILHLQGDEPGWRIERGHVSINEALPGLPDDPGVQISGYVDSLHVNNWITAFVEDPKLAAAELAGEGEGIWQDLFSRADLQIGELIAVNHQFVDVDARVDFNEAAWDIYLASPWLEGLVELPYQFDGPAPAELALERLLLIEPLDGDEPDEPEEYDLDPRDLPAMRGSADEFSLGVLRLGRLELDIQRTPTGLRSALLTTEADTFKTEMSADWSVVENAQRSRLHMELDSNDMADTLQKLGYSPLIGAKSGEVVADLLWEGGPGMGLVYESTGQIDLDIKDGVVNEVDPAGDKILGLLSVAYLPRRLSLDFSDMFQEGLVFDRLHGRFSIDFGNAWTCDLGLEGPATDMGIVGRANGVTEEFDQVVIVRPHVSNLAAGSAIMFAAPAVGLVTVLITQIFKKPLSNIGESYYTISGSWTEPNIEQVERDSLNTANFSDCESQLPELSPEEIEAIEELIAGESVEEEPVADAAPELGSSGELPDIAEEAVSDEPVTGESAPDTADD